MIGQPQAENILLKRSTASDQARAQFVAPGNPGMSERFHLGRKAGCAGAARREAPIGSEGQADLDDPIERWLPEFANPRVLKNPDGPLEDTQPAARSVSVFFTTR